MAKTRTPDEAVRYLRVRPGFDRLSDIPFAAEACDSALSMMWKAYSWDDSLVALPPMYMTPNESLIEAPARVVPGDLWYLERAWIVHVDSGLLEPELQVLHSLPESTWNGQPTSISHEPQRGAWRLYPTPGEAFGSPEYWITGSYKKQHTQITPANINSATLPFHDGHFNIYRAALKWAVLDLLGSREAGTVQVTNTGRWQYTGALGEFYALLYQAVEHELNRADENVYPSEGLMLGG